MLKVVVSFLFFLVELYVLKQEFKTLRELRYLIGNSGLHFGEVSYDYQTISPSIFQLVTKQHL